MERFEPCDRCGHRSFVFVIMADLLELRYCAHHGTEYLPKLSEVALDIDDRRRKNKCRCSTCEARR